MNDRNSKAGGIFIALGAVVGAIAGIDRGEPSLGLVIGLGAGAALAVVIYLIGRR